MILVTGATGHLGAAVIETLLKKESANNIAVFVRDEIKAADLKEKGVSIRVGNYDDVGSLDNAMQGVEKVLLISSNDEQNRMRQHKNVINSAKGAGVKCIAYAGRNLKDRNTLVNKLMEDHFETEDYIKESGLSYIIFRNTLYMDVLPLFVGGEKVLENGINLPAGNGKVSYALRSDLGEAMANVLADSDCDNRVYKFTASKAYFFDDIANIISKLSGKKVGYTDAEQSIFETQMKERGVPEVAIKKTVGFLTDIKNGQEAEVTTDLENALGRKSVMPETGLKELFNL